MNEFDQNQLRGFFDHHIKTLSRHNIVLSNVVTGHVPGILNIPSNTNYL